MEHFPPILHPFDPIEVPYKGGTYQGGNFATYPCDQTSPFDLARLQEGDLGEHSQDAVASMLQAWLYFGLLKETLQLDVNEADFVRQDDNGRSLITTANLRSYLHRWKISHESAKADPAELARRKTRTVEALRTSHAEWADFNDFAAIVGAEVELSIQLLGCALEHAVTSVSANSAQERFEPWVNGDEAPWRRTTSAFVEERMRRIGWCPSVIRQIRQPFKLALQTYVSLLRPSFDGGPEAHGECEFGDVGCRQNNINEATYVTRHVEGCECASKDPSAFLEVDGDELRRILKRGEIPLVYLDVGKERDGIARLQVVSWMYERQYTAISHVWADGLGNPRENALPLCQIRRITRLLSQTQWAPVPKQPPAFYNDSIWKRNDTRPSEPTFTSEELTSQPLYFWMDTLCVPPRDQDHELRKAAITQMRSVYSRANRVLVLDSSLLNTPGTLETLSASEVVARISASPWLRRYWTLQEALLARIIFYQFAEEAFRILEPPDHHFYDDEVRYCVDSPELDMRRNYLDTSETARVRSVWSSLYTRSTSHGGDEAICVATLLDMDVRKLLLADTSSRINRLWSMYTEFPLGVLCRPAEKLNDPTQPWAFSHMTDCALVPTPTLVPVVQRNKALHFSHHGCIISEPIQQTPIGLIAVELGGEHYFIRQNNKNGNLSWNGINFTSSGTRLAVVLGQSEPEPISGCLGALVSLAVVDGSAVHGDGVLKGRYLRAVSIMKKGGVFDQRPTPPWSLDEEKEKGKVYKAAWTRPDQRWEIRGHISQA